METTIIDKGNISLFKNLLLPNEAKLILEGKPVFALGLVDDGVACGAIAGGPYENYFKIKSFFVAPDYRRKSGATLLINTLKDLMLGIRELYEIRADFTVFNEEHTLLEKCLDKLGFEFENDTDRIFAVPLGSLANNPFFADKPTDVEVVSFSKLSPQLLHELDHTMRAGDGAPLSVPLDKAELDPDLSVAVKSGGHIDAFILFDHSYGGMLTLAYADSGSSAGGAVFSAMLKTAYRNALAKYSPDIRIVIQPVNPLSEALVEKLASGKELLSRSARLRIKE